MKKPETAARRIVLMGNPNVGKSMIFHRLTGVKVIVSNYPGTSIDYTRGYLKLPSDFTSGGRAAFRRDERIEVIDAPGVYSLEPGSPAEEVAVRLARDADLIVNVVDATNLERNLYLTLQLLELKLPMVVALNLWDETGHVGVAIDPECLARGLGSAVVPTVGVTGEGIRALVDSFAEAAPGRPVTEDPEGRWQAIGRIVGRCQTLSHHHHTFLQRLSDLSVQPLSGLLIAGGVLAGAFAVVRGVGEAIIGHLAEPLFENVLAPLFYRVSSLLGPGTLIHSILIGRLIEGEIDFEQSFGLLTTGLFVPLAMVLPYIFSFYLVLSFLEDFGYLPRLAVLLDNLMHRLGLHGYAIIPNLLGLGCSVPAILATRILESRRQRFIAATLISVAVPCAALQAMIFGLVGARGWQYVGVIYLTLFVVWLGLGLILQLTVPGYSPELIIEIPHYRFPPLKPLARKVRMRVAGFLREAVPIILVGVGVINLLYWLELFDRVADLFAPALTAVLGLPRESLVPILVGFLRKDVAVGMLAPLGLSAKQLVVATTVLAMFFPCIATFAVILRELGWKDLLKSIAVMVAAAILVGGALNLIL